MIRWIPYGVGCVRINHSILQILHLRAYPLLGDKPLHLYQELKHKDSGLRMRGTSEACARDKISHHF